MTKMDYREQIRNRRRKFKGLKERKLCRQYQERNERKIIETAGKEVRKRKPKRGYGKVS